MTWTAWTVAWTMTTMIMITIMMTNRGSFRKPETVIIDG